MNFRELQQAADVAMIDNLTSAGFRHLSPANWNRKKGNDLSVICFQKHTVSPSFCVNLGVHYSFIPKAGSMEMPDGDQIEQPECAIRMRFTADPATKDQWWPLTEASLSEVSKLIANHAFSIFDSYRLNGPITTIGIKEIETGAENLLSSLTKVSACLLLARMHEHLGNRTQGIEIATHGLKLSGVAVGPKKAFKDILRRFEQLA